MLRPARSRFTILMATSLPIGLHCALQTYQYKKRSKLAPWAEPIFLKTLKNKSNALDTIDNGSQRQVKTKDLLTIFHEMADYRFDGQASCLVRS